MLFRKKIGVGILAMTMLMSCLAGCSSNSTNKVQTVGEEKKEQVTLTFFGNKADESNVHPESVKFILFCNQLSKHNWLSIALIAVFFQFPH